MAVELDHPFTMSGSEDENLAKITDLPTVVPCVEGGSVTEVIGPESVKAEILRKMGAMSRVKVGVRGTSAQATPVTRAQAVTRPATTGT